MSQRAQRFAHLVQQELGELMRGIKDPRVADAGLITVTHVQVSDDLGVARVLVTLHDGDDEKKKALLKGLTSARGFLKSEIGRRLSTKKLPELRFELDGTDERAARIDAIFRELEAEKKS